MQSNFGEGSRAHNGQEAPSSQPPPQSYSSQSAANVSGPALHPALSVLPSRNYSTQSHLDEYFNNCVYQSKILSGQRPPNPSYKRNVPSDYPSDKRPYICYSSCCQPPYPPSPYSMNATATPSPIQFPFGRFNQQNIAENIGLQDHLLQNQQSQQCQQTDFHYLQPPSNPMYNQRVSHVNSRETPSGIGSHYTTSNYLHHPFYNTRPSFPPEYYKRMSNKSQSLKVNPKQQTSVIKSSNDFPYATEKTMTPINYAYNKRPEPYLPSYLPSCSQANFPPTNQYSSHQSAVIDPPSYHSSVNYASPAVGGGGGGGGGGGATLSSDSKPQAESVKKSSSKPPLNIDVRQFLETWDDDDDEPGLTSVESPKPVAVANKSSQPSANPGLHRSQPNENSSRSEYSTPDQENSVLFKILKPTAERRRSNENPYVSNVQHYPYNQVQLSNSNLPVDAHVNTNPTHPTLHQPYPKTMPNFSAPMFHPEALAYSSNDKSNKSDYSGGKVVSLAEKMCNSPSSYPLPLPLDQSQNKTRSVSPKKTYLNLDQNVIKETYPMSNLHKSTARSRPSTPTIDYDLRDQEQFIKPTIINKADYLKKDKADETIAKHATKVNAKKTGKPGKERNVSIVSPNVQRSDKIFKSSNPVPYNETMSQFHSSQIPYNKTTLMPYCIPPSNQLPNPNYEYPVMSVINNSHNYIKYDNRPNYTSEEHKYDSKYDSTCSVNINLNITSGKSPQVFLNSVSAPNQSHASMDSSRLITRGSSAQSIVENTGPLSQDAHKTGKRESDAQKAFSENGPSNLSIANNQQVKSTSFAPRSIPECIPEAFQIQSLIGPCKSNDSSASFRLGVKDSACGNTNKMTETAPVTSLDFHPNWSKISETASVRNQFDKSKSSYNPFGHPGETAPSCPPRPVENRGIHRESSNNLFEPLIAGSGEENVNRFLPHFASNKVPKIIDNSITTSTDIQSKHSQKAGEFGSEETSNAKVFDSQYYKSCLYDSSSFKNNVQESGHEKPEEYSSPFMVSRSTLDINSNSIEVKEKVGLSHDPSAKVNFPLNERVPTTCPEIVEKPCRETIVRVSNTQKNASPVSCSFSNSVITSTQQVSLDHRQAEAQEKRPVDIAKTVLNLMPEEISEKSKSEGPSKSFSLEGDKDPKCQELFVDEETIDSLINERCDTFAAVDFPIDSSANAEKPGNTVDRISPLSLLHFPETRRSESVATTLETTRSPQEDLQVPLENSRVLDVDKKTNPLQDLSDMQKTKVVCGMADLLNSDDEREDESVKAKHAMKKKAISSEFASFDLFNDTNEGYFSDVSCSKPRDKLCSSKNERSITNSAAINNCYNESNAGLENSQEVEGSKSIGLNLTKADNHTDFEMLVQNEMNKFNFESDILNMGSLEVESSQFFNDQNHAHELKSVSQTGSDRKPLSRPKWDRAKETYNINPDLNADTSEIPVSHVIKRKTSSKKMISDALPVSENSESVDSSGYYLPSLDEKTETRSSGNTSSLLKTKSSKKKDGRKLKQSRKTVNSTPSTELTPQKFNQDGVYSDEGTNSAIEKVHDEIFNLSCSENENSPHVKRVSLKRKLHGTSSNELENSQALCKPKIRSIDSLLESEAELSPVPSVAECTENVQEPQLQPHLQVRNNEALSSSNESCFYNQINKSNSEPILLRTPRKKKKKKRKPDKSGDSPVKQSSPPVKESSTKESEELKIFRASNESEKNEEMRASESIVEDLEPISNASISSNKKATASYDRELIENSGDNFENEPQANAFRNEEQVSLDLSCSFKSAQRVEISVNPPSDDDSNHSFDEKMERSQDNYFKKSLPDSTKHLHKKFQSQKLRSSLSQSSSADSTASSPPYQPYQSYQEFPNRCENEMESSRKFSLRKHKRFRSNLSESSSISSVISTSTEKVTRQGDYDRNDKTLQDKESKYPSNDDEFLDLSANTVDNLKATKESEAPEIDKKSCDENDSFFFRKDSSRTPKQLISPIRSRSDIDTYSDSDSVDDEKKIEELNFKSSVSSLNYANQQLLASKSPVMEDVTYEHADSPTQRDLQESLSDENLDQEVENCLKEVISIRFKINNPPNNLSDLKANEVVDPDNCLSHTESTKISCEKLSPIEVTEKEPNIEASEGIISPMCSPLQNIEPFTKQPHEELSVEVVPIENFPICSPFQDNEPSHPAFSPNLSETVISMSPTLQTYEPFSIEQSDELSSEVIDVTNNCSADSHLQNEKLTGEANEKPAKISISEVSPSVSSSLINDELQLKDVIESSPEDSILTDNYFASDSVPSNNTLGKEAITEACEDIVSISSPRSTLQSNEHYQSKSDEMPLLEDSVSVEHPSTHDSFRTNESFLKDGQLNHFDNSTASHSTHSTEYHERNLNETSSAEVLDSVVSPEVSDSVPVNQDNEGEPKVQLSKLTPSCVEPLTSNSAEKIEAHSKEQKSRPSDDSIFDDPPSCDSLTNDDGGNRIENSDAVEQGGDDRLSNCSVITDTKISSDSSFPAELSSSKSSLLDVSQEEIHDQAQSNAADSPSTVFPTNSEESTPNRKEAESVCALSTTQESAQSSAQNVKEISVLAVWDWFSSKKWQQLNVKSKPSTVVAEAPQSDVSMESDKTIREGGASASKSDDSIDKSKSQDATRAEVSTHSSEKVLPASELETADNSLHDEIQIHSSDEQQVVLDKSSVLVKSTSLTLEESCAKLDASCKKTDGVPENYETVVNNRKPDNHGSVTHQKYDCESTLANQEIRVKQVLTCKKPINEEVTSQDSNSDSIKTEQKCSIDKKEEIKRKKSTVLPSKNKFEKSILKSTSDEKSRLESKNESHSEENTRDKIKHTKNSVDTKYEQEKLKSRRADSRESEKSQRKNVDREVDTAVSERKSRKERYLKSSHENKSNSNKTTETASSKNTKCRKDADDITVKSKKEKYSGSSSYKMSVENRTVSPVSADRLSKVDDTSSEKKNKHESESTSIKKGRGFGEDSSDFLAASTKERDFVAVRRDRSLEDQTNSRSKYKTSSSKSKERSSRHGSKESSSSRSKSSDTNVIPRKNDRSKDEVKHSESNKNYGINSREKSSDRGNLKDIASHKAKKNDSHAYKATKSDRHYDNDAKHLDVKSKHRESSSRTEKEKTSSCERNLDVISHKAKETSPHRFVTKCDTSSKDEIKFVNKNKHETDSSKTAKGGSRSEKRIDLTPSLVKENTTHDCTIQNSRVSTNALKHTERAVKPMIDSNVEKKQISSLEKNVNHTSPFPKSNNNVITARSDVPARTEGRPTENESRHKIEAYCPVRNWECPFVTKDPEPSIKSGPKVEPWPVIGPSAMAAKQVNRESKSFTQPIEEDEIERPKTPKSYYSRVPKTPDVCIEQTFNTLENCFERNSTTPKVSQIYYDRIPKTPESCFGESFGPIPKTPGSCFGRAPSALENFNKHSSVPESFRETPKTPESYFDRIEEEEFFNNYCGKLTAQQPSVDNVRATEISKKLELANQHQEDILQDRSVKSKRYPEKWHHKDKYEASKNNEKPDDLSRKTSGAEVAKTLDYQDRTKESILKPKHHNVNSKEEIPSSKFHAIDSKVETKPSNSRPEKESAKQSDIASSRSHEVKTNDACKGNEATKSQAVSDTTFTPCFDLDFDKQEINFDNFHILFDQTWEKFSKLKDSNKKSKETSKPDVQILTERKETTDKKSVEPLKCSVSKNINNAKTSSTSDKGNIKFKINLPDKKVNSSEVGVAVSEKRNSEEINSDVNDNLKLLQNVFGTNKTRYKPSVSQYQSNSHDVPYKLTSKVNPSSLSPDNSIYFAENYKILDVSKIPLPPYDSRVSRNALEKSNICVEDSNVINYKLLAMMGNHVSEMKKVFRSDSCESNSNWSTTFLLSEREPSLNSTPAASKPVTLKKFGPIIPKVAEEETAIHSGNAEKSPSSFASKMKDKDTLYCNLYKKLIKNKRLNKEKERLNKENRLLDPAVDESKKLLSKLEILEKERDILQTTSDGVDKNSLLMRSPSPTKRLWLLSSAKPGIIPLPFESKRSQIDRNSVASLGEICKDKLCSQSNVPLKSKVQEQHKESNEPSIEPENVKLVSKLDKLQQELVVIDEVSSTPMPESEPEPDTVKLKSKLESQQELNLIDDVSSSLIPIESDVALTNESTAIPLALESKISETEDKSNNGEPNCILQSRFSENEEKSMSSTCEETSEKPNSGECAKASVKKSKTVFLPEQPTMFESASSQFDSEKDETSNSTELSNDYEKLHSQKKPKNPRIDFDSNKDERYRTAEEPISSLCKKFKASVKKVKTSGLKSDKKVKPSKQNQNNEKLSSSCRSLLKALLPTTTTIREHVEAKLNFDFPPVEKVYSAEMSQLSKQAEDKNTSRSETEENSSVSMGKVSRSEEEKLDELNIESEKVIGSPVVSEFLSHETMESDYPPDSAEIASLKSIDGTTDAEMCDKMFLMSDSLVESFQESEIPENETVGVNYQSEVVPKIPEKGEQQQESSTDVIHIEESKSISQSSVIKSIDEIMPCVPDSNNDKNEGDVQDPVNEDCTAEKTKNDSVAEHEDIVDLLLVVEDCDKIELENNLLSAENGEKAAVLPSKIKESEIVIHAQTTDLKLVKPNQESTLLEAAEDSSGSGVHHNLNDKPNETLLDNRTDVCSSEFVSEISKAVELSQDVFSCRQKFTDEQLTETSSADHSVDTQENTDLTQKDFPTSELIQPEHPTATYFTEVGTEIFDSELTQENEPVDKACTLIEQSSGTVSTEVTNYGTEIVEQSEGNVFLSEELIPTEQSIETISDESENIRVIKRPQETTSIGETCNSESGTEGMEVSELTEEVQPLNEVTSLHGEKFSDTDVIDFELVNEETSEPTQEIIPPCELLIGDEKPAKIISTVPVTEVLETQEDINCSVTYGHDQPPSPTIALPEASVPFSNANCTLSDDVFKEDCFSDRMNVDAVTTVDILLLSPDMLAADGPQNSPKSLVETIDDAKAVLDPSRTSPEEIISFEEDVSVEPLYFNVETEVVIGSSTDESVKGRLRDSPSAEDKSLPRLIGDPVSENMCSENGTRVLKRRKRGLRKLSDTEYLHQDSSAEYLVKRKRKKRSFSKSRLCEAVNVAIEDSLQPSNLSITNPEEMCTNDVVLVTDDPNLDDSQATFDLSSSFQISSKVDSLAQVNSVSVANICSDFALSDEETVVNTCSNYGGNTFNSSVEGCLPKINEKISFFEPVERESFSMLKEHKPMRKCKSVELLSLNILSPEIGSNKSSRSVDCLRLKSCDSESSVSPSYLKGIELDGSNSFLKCFSFLKDNMPFIGDPSSCLAENETEPPSLVKEMMAESSDALCLPAAGSPVDENLTSMMCESQLSCINDSVDDSLSQKDGEDLPILEIDLDREDNESEQLTPDSSKGNSRDLKVRLPWNRIFNLKKQRKKRNITSSKGIELGPAKIEIRLNSSENSGSWKVIQNSSVSVSSGSNCSLGSPIGIKVNRLVLQRHPANDSDNLRNTQSEICPPGGKAEIIPNVIIKKKGSKCYKSYFKFTSKRQPVVRLLREKHIDLLALELKETRNRLKLHPSSGLGVEQEQKDPKTKKKNATSVHECALIAAASDGIDTPKKPKNTSKSRKMPKLLREMQLDIPPELDLDCPTALATRRKSVEKKKASEFNRIMPKKIDTLPAIVEEIDSAPTTVVELENARLDHSSHSELSHVSEDQVSEDVNHPQEVTSKEGENDEISVTDKLDTIPDEACTLVESSETEGPETSLKCCQERRTPVKRKSRSISFDSNNKEVYQKLRLDCQVCRDSLQRTDSSVNVLKELFHCTRCCLGFKSHEEEALHNSTFHNKEDSGEAWSCSLCRKTFGSQLSLRYHLKGRLHQLLESVQIETITSLFAHFTGKDCPHLKSGSTSPHPNLENQLTPLQIVLKGESSCAEISKR